MRGGGFAGDLDQFLGVRQLADRGVGDEDRPTAGEQGGKPDDPATRSRGDDPGDFLEALVKRAGHR